MDKFYYILVHRHMNVGGGQLLFQRLAKQLMDYGNSVCVFCETADSIMEARFQKDGIKLKKIAYWDSVGEFFKDLDKGIECRVLTFDWKDYAKIYNYNKISKKTIYYVLSPDELLVCKSINIGFVKKIIFQAMGRSIARHTKAGNIFYMDEISILHTRNYYGKCLKANEADYKIVRIPIENTRESGFKVNFHENRKEIRILTIARADFPMKGYMCGLIDYVGETDANVSLDIVSYGPNIEELKSKISSLSEDKRGKINLYGKVDHAQLGHFFQVADIYVGMGTTLLDAALAGVLAVPVAAYTMELQVDGFFHEDYRVLVLDKDSSPKAEDAVKRFNGLIQKIAKMDGKQYSELATRARDLVTENYGIEGATNRILQKFEMLPEDNKDWQIRLMAFLVEKIASVIHRKKIHCI